MAPSGGVDAGLRNDCAVSSGGDGISADCQSSGGGGGGSAAARRGITVGPVCAWAAIDPLGFFGPDFENLVASEGEPYGFDTDTDGGILRTWPDGRVEKGWLVTCDNATSGFRWVDNTISTADVIAAASQQVRARIPEPTMNINPPPELGGYVNLGMWLAIDPADDISITARAGYVWATVTARLDATDWTFGNGDSVQCPGIGVPIADLDTPEEGPCGYTYGRSSAENDPYQLGVTANWAVTYTSNAGSGTLSPITPATVVSYDVDEIQTVGERG